MLLNLSEVQFENDFFTIDLPDGSVLTLNKIDEDMRIDSETGYAVNRINVQIAKTDEETQETIIENCTNVIGMESNNVHIYTDYDEYNGKVLTKDNMKYCKVEYYEQ